MRRPGPRLIAPRATGDVPLTLSPWPINTPLLRAPDDAPWQRWFSALGTAVNTLLATGGGGGGTPAAHAPTHEPGGSDPLAVDAAAAVGSLRTLGSGATQAAPGNDARFSAPSVPTAHQTTHQSGGTDVVNVTLLGGYPGGTGTFLRADGTFAAPPAGSLIAHHATHEPGGSDVLLNNAWTNLANVFTADQTLSKINPVLSWSDSGQAVDSKLWKLWAGGSFFVQACSDAGAPLTQPLRLERNGSVLVGGTLTANGLLTVNGFGTHTFSASGSGGQTLYLANTAAGAGNVTRFLLGNDLGGNAYLDLYPSTFASSGRQLANGVLLENALAGGLSVSVLHPSGAIRFYSGGGTERARVNPDGRVVINSSVASPGARVYIAANFATEGEVLALRTTQDAAGGIFQYFYNASGAIQGSIQAPNSTTVQYNAASDQRLKDDRGVAADLTGLRALVVHDFVWTHDDRPDRGVFAQEAHRVFPRAVSVGDDTRTETGTLAKPWMTDYSKFVPDLIVGWQQHEARLAALEAKETHAE